MVERAATQTPISADSVASADDGTDATAFGADERKD